MSRIPENLQEKWRFIGSKKYADQCKWMLNGFWQKLEPDAEKIWGYCQTFARLDEAKRADGCDLDEFWSHKFLESLGQTMTVIEMREKFRQIDADFNKRMSMIEFLIFKFHLKIADVVNAPQGENKEALAKAEAMVLAAQRAVDEMTVKLDISKKAADAALKAAEAAWFAEQENKKALEELQKQEKAYNDKKAELEATKGDTSIGLVKRNKAANELEQLLAEDPLPLRRAKLNQAAAVKKSEKARALADETKAKAEADAAAAEASVREAEAKLQEAIDFLEKTKKMGGVAKGDIWWMQREITEKQKYLPQKRRV